MYVPSQKYSSGYHCVFELGLNHFSMNSPVLQAFHSWESHCVTLTKSLPNGTLVQQVLSFCMGESNSSQARKLEKCPRRGFVTTFWTVLCTVSYYVLRRSKVGEIADDVWMSKGPCPRMLTAQPTWPIWRQGTLILRFEWDLDQNCGMYSTVTL